MPSRCYFDGFKTNEGLAEGLAFIELVGGENGVEQFGKANAVDVRGA